MRELLLSGVLMVAACNGSRQARPDARENEPTEIDAADAIDAPPDSPPDSPPDAPPTPSTCAATAAMLIDLSPRIISNITIAGSTLYIGSYEQANQTISNGSVLALDAMTGAQAYAPFTTTGAPWVWRSGSDVYVTDSAPSGAIWKLHPGDAPVAVVTDRPRPRIATADATHVYWAESGVSGDTLIRRKAFAGSMIEDVMSCLQATRLAVDANYVYCGGGDHGILRAPKTGGQTTSLGYVTQGITSMVEDANTLYFVTLHNNPQLWQAPMPSGPSTMIKQVQELGRYEGIGLTASYYYTVDNNYGIRRIHRTALTVDRIYSALFVARDPMIVGNRLYFVANNPQILGPNYVMTCVD